MKQFFVICLLLLGGAQIANADVWKWTDANGATHFVDTFKAIYTWRDDAGNVQFSDKPEHEGAVAVQLVWHSAGSLQDLAGDSNDEEESAGLRPGESELDRADREQAEAYMCKRATEAHNSYVSAPRLYRTNDDGEREYLDEAATKELLAESAATKDALCK
ncbi:MAG: DUF4124 domain-containing protein [Woeseiaceae bacterium]|jgi:hypothetical protein